MEINIIKEQGVETPVYATEGSSGFDLKVTKLLKLFSGSVEVDLTKILKNSIDNGHFFLRPGERVLMGTGIKMEIPEGYELQVRSRSGTALKRGLVVANSPGTIDSDYRGEIGIIILNTTNHLAQIKFNESLAQGVICPVVQKVSFTESEELSDTERGFGGFGSTNK